MNFTEFCELRGVQPAALNMYISRHKDVFDGHLTKVGRIVEMDQYAFDELSKKYPGPTGLVEIQDSADTLERLRIAEEEAKRYRELFEAQQQETNKLLKQVNENLEAVAEAKLKMALLEDKNIQLEESKKEREKLDEELREQTQKTNDEKNRADLAEKDLEHTRVDLARAEAEASSFKKTILGFYKKIK